MEEGRRDNDQKNYDPEKFLSNFSPQCSVISGKQVKALDSKVTHIALDFSLN